MRIGQKMKTCNHFFREVSSEFSNTTIDLETRFYSKEKVQYLTNFDGFRLLFPSVFSSKNPKTELFVISDDEMKFLHFPVLCQNLCSGQKNFRHFL